MAKSVQSVESKIEEKGNGWLREYGLPYKIKNEHFDKEYGDIDNALNNYESKSGGKGGNVPDAKLLLEDKYSNKIPILIEYKGYKDKLVKLDCNGNVENKKTDSTANYVNIKAYAVNGAVHYANALLHYTEYSEIIAVGMTGYKNEFGNLEHEIGVYYVSKSNLGAGQKAGDYTDFSFLKAENFIEFIEEARKLSLTKEELEEIKEQREREIDASLVKLNNDIYKNEQGLSERERIYLVAASIIASLGVPGEVAPLKKSDLQSLNEDGNRDGDIILRKIKAFFGKKGCPRKRRNGF